MDVEIGPWVLIEAGVQIGDRCRIEAHAQLLNTVALGDDCVVRAGALIGGDPQDTSFSRNTPSRVEIGSGNTIGENVTIHRSASENEATRIGDRNYFMAASHIGHDCVVGDDNILANNCLLGGHVQLGNRSFLGGGSAFHQFIRIGDLCIVKGLSAISRDVPPFVTASGVNQISGLNVIGLRRAGFSREARIEVKQAFNHVYREGKNLSQSIAKRGELKLGPEAQVFLDFFESVSKKGVCMR